jgi:hypothetical protein
LPNFVRVPRRGRIGFPPLFHFRARSRPSIFFKCCSVSAVKKDQIYKKKEKKERESDEEDIDCNYLGWRGDLEILEEKNLHKTSRWNENVQTLKRMANAWQMYGKRPRYESQM